MPHHFIGSIMSKKFIDSVEAMSGVYEGREWSYNDYIFSISDHYSINLGFREPLL